MTAHHPWLKTSPEKVRAKLAAVSWDACGLWGALQLYIAGTGGDGTIPIDRLHLATDRRLSQARCVKLLDELVTEGLAERPTATTAAVLPWEQPPIETWTDDTKRFRWQRAKELQLAQR